jgi:excisionase family DNA binding protein
MSIASRPEGPSEPPLLHGVPDTARILGLGRSTVWLMIKTGKLSTVRFGRRTLIPRAAIERLAAGDAFRAGT